MKLGTKGNTQGKHLLSSWKSDDDPTPGNFVVGLSAEQPPQIFTWRNSKPNWRGGPWDGGKFIGIPEQDAGYSELLNRWDDGSSMWDSYWEVPLNPCDVYGVCGAFAICTSEKSPICDCLKGFVPQSNDEWAKGNWTRGCVRRNELVCEKNETSLASGKAKPDQFQVLKGVKLPDHYHYFPYRDTGECQQLCLGNCSCKAYAQWRTQEIFNGGADHF
ncbi:putative non-specific serine/threonine protein kinase [Helianthus annuus]|nr:putative non-specific serine/threonine protein kinase [Helianthus annuus]